MLPVVGVLRVFLVLAVLILVLVVLAVLVLVLQIGNSISSGFLGRDTALSATASAARLYSARSTGSAENTLRPRTPHCFALSARHCLALALSSSLRSRVGNLKR